MERFGAYILSVTAAAIVGTVATRLLRDQGMAAELGKVLVGLFLLLSLLRPLMGQVLPDLSQWHYDYTLAAQDAVALGEMTAKKALEQRIKDQTEAYILNKAASLQAKIQVEVVLSGDSIPVPVGVKLSGQISPYAKNQLQRLLQQELGIAKENQQWT